MIKKLFCLSIFFLIVAIVSAQKTDKKLQLKIEDLIRDFKGDIGVYVKDIKNKTTVAINADSVFPTASMIKVPILIGIMDKINKGGLQYHQQLVYKDSLLYEGEDILGSFKTGEKIELSKVMMLMLTMSDNTASLWLQSLAGTGTRINEIVDSLGFKITRVNSRTPGREVSRNDYGWGQTSPKEMASLLEKIYRGEIINDSLSNNMLRLLGRNYWDEQALSQVPPTIEVFSKSGAVDETRNEVLLVNAPHHPYVFCICTKNNKDQSWNADNEAWVLTRKISKLLWEYFEPHYQRY
ncbi:MAG: beta-lactamase [Chitinophagaceae bacterium]|nr:beta-lactamase [Chitinophagaceae bacterium]